MRNLEKAIMSPKVTVREYHPCSQHNSLALSCPAWLADWVGECRYIVRIHINWGQFAWHQWQQKWVWLCTCYPHHIRARAAQVSLLQCWHQRTTTRGIAVSFNDGCHSLVSRYARLQCCQLVVVHVECHSINTKTWHLTLQHCSCWPPQTNSTTNESGNGVQQRFWKTAQAWLCQSYIAR